MFFVLCWLHRAGHFPIPNSSAYLPPGKTSLVRFASYWRIIIDQPESAPKMVQLPRLYQKMRNEPNKSFAINKTLEERTQMM